MNAHTSLFVILMYNETFKFVQDFIMTANSNKVKDDIY